MSPTTANPTASDPAVQAPGSGHGPSGHRFKRADLALAADPARIAAARHEVTAHVRGWNLGHLAEDAALITSELVTNAVLHGGVETITVHLAECGVPGESQLLIAVTDKSAAVPSACCPADAEEHGRGLLILQCVAACWGVVAKPGGGKLVWATLTVKLPDPVHGTGPSPSPCCAGSRWALTLA